MKVTIKKDTSEWNKIKRNLLGADQSKIKVGWFEGSRYDSENENLPVAQIAQFNEEGSIHNPVRPFIRFGFMPKVRGEEYRKVFEASIKNVLDGNTTFRAEYTKLGTMLVAGLKRTITEWATPPNSPQTIAEKGFNDPLIWTGTMRDTVEFKIEPGDN